MEMLNVLDSLLDDLMTNQKFLQEYDAGKNVEERLEWVESILKHKVMVKRHEAVIELAKKETLTDDFERVYKEKWAEAQTEKINIRNTKEFKSYKERIEAISKTKPLWNQNGEKFTDADLAETASSSKNDTVADVVEVTEEAFAMIDPWTRAIMKNPVRNTKCGHNYELESTLAMLEKDASLKCPVNGCVNKHLIQKKHLEPNETLRRRIEVHLDDLRLSTDDESEAL